MNFERSPKGKNQWMPITADEMRECMTLDTADLDHAFKVLREIGRWTGRYETFRIVKNPAVYEVHFTGTSGEVYCGRTSYPDEGTAVHTIEDNLADERTTWECYKLSEHNRYQAEKEREIWTLQVEKVESYRVVEVPQYDEEG